MPTALPSTTFDPYQTARVLIPGIYVTAISATLTALYAPKEVWAKIPIETLALLAFVLPVLIGLLLYSLDLPKHTPFSRLDNPSALLVKRCLQCKEPCGHRLQFTNLQISARRVLMADPCAWVRSIVRAIFGRRHRVVEMADLEAEPRAAGEYFYLFNRFISGDMKSKIEYFNNFFLTCENLRLISLFGALASFALQGLYTKVSCQYWIPGAVLSLFWFGFLIGRKHREYRRSSEKMQCEWLEKHPYIVKRVVCQRADPEDDNAADKIPSPQ